MYRKARRRHHKGEEAGSGIIPNRDTLSFVRKGEGGRNKKQKGREKEKKKWTEKMGTLHRYRDGTVSIQFYFDNQ